MGLLGGAFDAVKGAAKIVTSLLRTGAKMLGTGLETAGGVVSNVAQGDLKGAANSVSRGVDSQIGNVTGFFGDNINSAKEIAGGHVEFLKGGFGLIGTPVKGAARLAGNGLSTGGRALTELAEGDLNGAAGATTQGISNGFRIAGQTVESQVSNVF